LIFCSKRVISSRLATTSACSASISATITSCLARDGLGAPKKGAQLLGRYQPVYLFHSDSHYFRIDKPLADPITKRTLENFTRIETFGGLNLHLVRVQVDPTAAEPLTTTPLIIEANRVDPTTPLPSRK